MHQDLTKELLADIDSWAVEFPKVLADIDALLTENRIFKQRNVDIGIVQKTIFRNMDFQALWCEGPDWPGFKASSAL